MGSVMFINYYYYFGSLLTRNIILYKTISKIQNTTFYFLVRSTCSQDTCMHGVNCVEGNETTTISCPCPPTLAGDRCESKDSLSWDKTNQSSL